VEKKDVEVRGAHLSKIAKGGAASVVVTEGWASSAFLTAMCNQYFGMDRYVRPIDSTSPFWLNQANNWPEK
jgi:hypothetical protein